MLVSILALYWLHGRATGTYTFDYGSLRQLAGDYPAARLLMLGFFVGFAVKLPAVPIHAWLPDAHTEAPTAGSVLLAGLLLKTGGYGLIRFAVPLFPEASQWWAGTACLLGVIGILYGAILSFAQRDLKRLVAYSSISHLGFVLLGVYSGGELAMQGAVLQMLTHGISTGALFIIAGIIQERSRTRDLEAMSGLWETTPRLGAFGLLFVLAALGLPGLGNFIAEFLVLLGAYQSYPVLAMVAAGALIVSPCYALRIIQKAFHGANERRWQFRDLAWHEWATLLPMAVIIIWLGLNPQPTLGLIRPALERFPPTAAATMVIER
jgi:NADH-quinone oxidoreductase subunit M